MSKIAVIDIGSNSVRMVIFDAMARAPHYIFNEKSLCRLGAGLSETGHLSPEGVVSAKSELERFIYIAKAMNVSSLEIVATAAMREASDGPDFVAWVKAHLHEDVRVISGEEEAQLSAQGVLLGWPDAQGVISDIGGSSMELINVENGQIGRGATSKLGPLNLDQMDKSKRETFIEKELKRLLEIAPKKPECLYLVGGSWRAFAKCDMARKNYPFQILHEYTMTRKDIETTLKFIKKHDLAKLNQLTGTSLARLELLPRASKVLHRLVEKLAPETIAVSAYGLREGMLYENMPNWMRAADPLIAAAEALEAESARTPGFGRKLYEWLGALRVDLTPEQDRIFLAACLLHDTNWRFHPDFRAQIGYEVVAQANFCGVTHRERIFMALALAARYENKAAYANEHPATALLSQAQREAAWSLGRAMRLGAMLSGSVASLLDHMPLSLEDGVLKLRIKSEYRPLYGESVDKRLEALGKVMGQNVEILFI